MQSDHSNARKYDIDVRSGSQSSDQVKFEGIHGIQRLLNILARVGRCDRRQVLVVLVNKLGGEY